MRGSGLVVEIAARKILVSRRDTNWFQPKLAGVKNGPPDHSAASLSASSPTTAACDSALERPHHGLSNGGTRAGRGGLWSENKAFENWLHSVSFSKRKGKVPATYS